jgi:putative transposase
MKTLAEKRALVKPDSKLSIRQQCILLAICRSGLYYTPSPETEQNLEIMRLLDEQYLKTPFYGLPRINQLLKDKGYSVNKKRVKRLMNLIGWQTLFPRKNTSRRNKMHPVYPYLLKGLKITRPNQVWAIDITYIPMKKGFMYLIAIIDVYTRCVLTWSISNTMTADWCREVVEEAIVAYGYPEIINSDQGSQFTSQEYTSLFTKDGVTTQISMDGKGRCIDNIFIERLWRSVKYECVYLYAFEDGVQLYEGLKEYFRFYNTERGHQSLDYQKPADLYGKVA